MIRIILAQLNVYNNTITVPLASGYLKAFTCRNNLSKNIDIEILNKEANNFYGDSKIVSCILNKDPDIIGFSCYVWNIDRTLSIIERLKSIKPGLKVICGGTEVSRQYRRYLKKDTNIDIIVIGEGEITFKEILESYLNKGQGLSYIRGIAFCSNGKIMVTPKRPQIEDINIVPSPYLSGLIDVKEYEKLFIETYRGCIEKCAYCNWNRDFNGLRFFSEGRIKKEITLARDNKVDCWLTDPVFNLPHNLNRLKDAILEVNKDKVFRLYVEGRAEYIDDKSARLLTRFNIGRIGIGLQTTGARALINAGRWFDKKLFAKGINLLKKHKIPFRIDLIVGLPGDTEGTIKGMFRFVKRFVGFHQTHCEVLRMQPDTKIRKLIKRFNIKFYRNKPYSVISHNTMPHSSLKRVFSAYYKNHEKDYIAESPDDIAKMYLSKQILDFPQDYYIDCKLENGKIDKGVFSYFFIEVDSEKKDLSKIRRLAGDLKQVIGIYQTIFFRCRKIDQDIPIVKEFLNYFSKDNQHCCFKIILDALGNEDGSGLRGLAKSIRHKKNYAELKDAVHAELLGNGAGFYSPDIYLIRPLSMVSSVFNKKTAVDKAIMPKISISNNLEWKEEIQQLFALPYRRILVEIDNESMGLKTDVLKYLYKNKKIDKRIYFSDPVLSLFYNGFMVKNYDISGVIKEYAAGKFNIPKQAIQINKKLEICFKQLDFNRALLRLIDFKNASGV